MNDLRYGKLAVMIIYFAVRLQTRAADSGSVGHGSGQMGVNKQIGIGSHDPSTHDLYVCICILKAVEAISII